MKGMMNKTGKVPIWIWIMVGIFAVVVAATGAGFSFSAASSVDVGSIASEIGNAQSFDSAFGPSWFDYIFGKIPSLLVEYTNPVSAGIIVIGLWFLLFLTFGDVLGVFGFFNQMTSWIAGGVLALIAANLKLISLISVSLLAVTAGLGVLSVFASLILAFVAFFGLNLGVGKFKEWAFERKKAELKMKAAMGDEKAKAGLRTLAGIGEESYSLGK